jgi:hypothetical protein
MDRKNNHIGVFLDSDLMKVIILEFCGTTSLRGSWRWRGCGSRWV